MFRRVTLVVDLLARAMALLGGAALIGLVAMTCISIAGRSLTGFGLGPVPGDFEMIEIGVGFAIFSFLPWAHLKGAHARVDLLASAYGPRLNRAIDLGADVLMFAAAVLMAWRLWLGLLDKHRYDETTFILQVPVWPAYAAGLVGAAVFAVVAAYCIWRSLRRLNGTADEQY